ncbi:UDP-N-acetylglucosamine 2-epimerase (non-hydrolysing) [Lachnospiraceae bacterium YSD2013]|nr:UDP-N-acetylglucosamine 2-epimerase (non-hydrolysing) [Lachnospiraceae bacterium YSD2013]
MAKVLSIVGARPQFIKAAVVSKELRKVHKEVLVHTGQHYDYNMSEMFFHELSIPKPNYNLGISGGSHAEMTARMMVAIEKVVLQEKPDWILLYGDTNSTLAAALVAAKLHVPICHVEAGVRFHVMTNPEEINRVCVDHISTKLLACTESSMDELTREGLSDRARLVGDPMYDAFCQYSEIASIKNGELLDLSGNKVLVPKKFYYLTCHREENTNREGALYEILKAMNSLDSPTIYPVHPRNRMRALEIREQFGFNNVIMTEPVGYLESIYLVNEAKKVVTDSGGLQREAFFAKKKCVTVLDFVVWPETMVGNRNQLAKPCCDEILERLNSEQILEADYLPFGDGKSALKIVKELS